MRDQHDRAPLLPQLLNGGEQRRLPVRIETCVWLIQNDVGGFAVDRRANPMRWRWPPDKANPPSPICVLYPAGMA